MQTSLRSMTKNFMSMMMLGAVLTLRASLSRDRSTLERAIELYNQVLTFPHLPNTILFNTYIKISTAYYKMAKFGNSKEESIKHGIEYVLKARALFPDYPEPIFRQVNKFYSPLK